MKTSSDKPNPWSGAISREDPGKIDWENRKLNSENGKGDSPRNVGKRFKENFDKIDWSK